MLDIKSVINKDELIVGLDGRLDTTTAIQLEKALEGATDGVSLIIIDASRLQYISSAGLRVLLSTQKQISEHGRMVIRNVSNEVQEIFEVTGFTEILTIE
ncbi:MAG: STAS domain-containing protein [Lachnospiraceae bacterium]|nr:STAS domain-containing protein [Lachnospiraceae bacterium]